MSSVREEVMLDALVQICPFVDNCTQQCTPAGQDNCWGELAKRLLSLKYPNGEPMIGILSEDQSLPDYNDYYKAVSPYAKYTQARMAAWSRGQLQMLYTNFKRIEVEE